jgi:flagellar assembly protein FliH
MRDQSQTVVQLLQYPDAGESLPDFWSSLPKFDDPSPAIGQASNQTHQRDAAADSSVTTASTSSSEELQRRFESGREQGIHEGRELERQSHSTRLHEIEQSRITQAAESIDQFARERDKFFATIERDVVELALQIAERVLRREAQMDPLFLLGAVRVALGQLAESIHVRVRVPAAEAELWTETVAHLPSLKARPEIVPDAEMHLGDCLMESEMGSVDLGLDSQVHSIKHALVDETTAPTQPWRPQLDDEDAE